MLMRTRNTFCLFKLNFNSFLNSVVFITSQTKKNSTKKFKSLHYEKGVNDMKFFFGVTDFANLVTFNNFDVCQKPLFKKLEVIEKITPSRYFFVSFFENCGENHKTIRTFFNVFTSCQTSHSFMHKKTCFPYI